MAPKPAPFSWGHARGHLNKLTRIIKAPWRTRAKGPYRPSNRGPFADPSPQAEPGDGRRALVIDQMARDPDQLRGYINLMFVARHLERVGDHATNIAEDAVYAAAAEDIRHQQVAATPA